VHAPDPYRSGIAPEKTAAQALLAVTSRALPVFVASGERVSLAGNPDAGAPWAVGERVFAEPSGAESRQEMPLTPADWAVNEARFQDYFRVMPKGQSSDSAMPLSDVIARAPDEREGIEPIIHFAGDGGRHLIAEVAVDMTRWTAARARVWEWLRGLEGLGAASSQGVSKTTEEQAEPAPAPAPVPATTASAASAHEALTQRLLQLSGFSADPEFFQRSLRDFVLQRNAAAQGQDSGGDDGGE
jgi:hypothetical protein